jgi:hypothetical protein
MVGQVAQHPGHVHFRVSGLAAVLHRSLKPTFCSGASEPLGSDRVMATILLVDDEASTRSTMRVLGDLCDGRCGTAAGFHRPLYLGLAA